MKRGFLTLTVIGCLLTCACSSGQAGPIAETTEEGATSTMGYDFGEFSNVNITGIDFVSLSDEELSVLYAQAKYCQAMTDADIEVMRELVSEDKTFTHMSGLQQTRHGGWRYGAAHLHFCPECQRIRGKRNLPHERHASL